MRWLASAELDHHWDSVTNHMSRNGMSEISAFHMHIDAIISYKQIGWHAEKELIKKLMMVTAQILFIVILKHYVIQQAKALTENNSRRIQAEKEVDNFAMHWLLRKWYDFYHLFYKQWVGTKNT